MNWWQEFFQQFLINNSEIQQQKNFLSIRHKTTVCNIISPHEHVLFPIRRAHYFSLVALASKNINNSMQTQLICAYLTSLFYIMSLYVCAYVYLPHIYLYLIILSFLLARAFFHSFFPFFLPSIPYILLMVPSYTHTHILLIDIIFIVTATTIQWIRTGKKKEFQTRVEPYAPYVIITYMFKRFFYIHKKILFIASWIFFLFFFFRFIIK